MIPGLNATPRKKIMNIFTLPLNILPICLTTRARIIFSGLFILFISACSFKTLYNQLDYLIPSYVEGMVYLDDVLEEKVEQRTDVLLSWHRNTQLTQYADLLRTFQQDLESPLTEQRVLQHMATMQLLWESLEVKLNKEMAELLPLLNSEQREELFESIDDKNEDFYDDYIDLDNDERLEQYTETTLDSYQNWLGDLTDQQEQAVEKAAMELGSSAALRLQQRQLWQRSIQEILDSADPETIKSERLQLFFDSFNINDQPQLAAVTEANKKVFARLTVEITAQLTTEQKTFFKSKTDEYIRIFTELAENR